MSGKIDKLTQPPEAYGENTAIARNPRRAFYIVAYVLFGIIAIIGFVLSYVSTERIPQLLGDGLKYISTVGFTTLFAWFFAQSYAQRRYTAELLQIIQPLSVATTDVRHATFTPKRNIGDYEHSLIRIGASSDQIVAAIGSLEKLCGAFARDARLEINDRVRKLAAENEELKNALSNVTLTLERLDDVADENDFVELRKDIGKVLKKTFLRESVECPFCSNSTPVYIGEALNDGATPACVHCGNKFHAHRRRDFIEGVKPGGAASVRVVVGCGACGNSIPLNVVEGDPKHQVRFCADCGAKNTIDPLASAVVMHEKKKVLDGRVDAEGVAHCVNCTCGGELVHCFLRPDGSTCGVCVSKDSLVRCPRTN